MNAVDVVISNGTKRHKHFSEAAGRMIRTMRGVYVLCALSNSDRVSNLFRNSGSLRKQKMNYTKNKYRAKKAECCQGHIHDSKAESYRCDILHIKQKHGEISDLRIQVKFEILASAKYDNMPNEKGISYIADFVYTENGMTIIEDVKSEKTRENPDYIIKRKFVKKLYCTDGKTIFRETFAK